MQFAGDLIIISGQSDEYRRQAAEFALSGGLRVTADLPKPIQIAELRDVLANIKDGLFRSLLDQYGVRRPHTPGAKKH